MKIVGRDGCLETQPTGTLSEGPAAVIGIMAPLPLQSEFLTFKLIATDGYGWRVIARDCGLPCRDDRLEMVAGIAEERPSVDPGDRLQHRQSAEEVAVLKEEKPGIPILQLDKSTLMESGPGIVHVIA